MRTTQKGAGLLRLMVLSIAIQFNSFISTAQIGVVIVNEGEVAPIDQWYMVRDDTEENTVYIYNEDKYIHELLEQMLKRYDLKLKDADTDNEGTPFFYLDHSNGYQSYVWYIQEEEGMALLQVSTFTVIEE